MRSIVESNRYFKFENDFYCIINTRQDEFSYEPVGRIVRRKSNDFQRLEYMSYEEFGNLLSKELLRLVDDNIHDQLELLILQKEMLNAR